MVVTRSFVSGLAALALLLAAGVAGATVLPDDRADALYHSYDGGGVEITGPSLLVLKKFGQNVAVTGNYYVDSVSSASIDVITSGASEYAEDRTEFSGGVDYLHGNSVMSLSYGNSSENDYEANTVNFGISMDMFGNMTTLSLGYGHSWDTVSQNGNPLFIPKDVRRDNYRLGISQVITKDMVLELNYEGITDEGFLNNPYRVVNYDDGAGGRAQQPEIYPRTRTSSALTLRSKYYLPWRAAASAEYRFFTDTWDIDAHTFKVGYTHPLSGGLLLEGSVRHYTQTAADFYSDLFPFANAQNFMARDKELSTFSSNTLGIKVSYDVVKNGWRAIDKGSINLAYDMIWFDYDDFRDARVTGVTAGTEPLYNFSASVLQLYLSLWF